MSSGSLKSFYSTTKTFINKSPFQTFHFTELEPDTDYVAVFHGINSEEAGKVFALFKTKKEEIDQFTILALSCDRPDRLLLGQTNPWYQVAAQTYNTDVILHLGDQVYNKGEDNDATCDLFGSPEFLNASEDKKKSYMKRGRELLANKTKSLKSRERGELMSIDDKS